MNYVIRFDNENLVFCKTIPTTKGGALSGQTRILFSSLGLNWTAKMAPGNRNET